jgi:hypothetical protein
MPHESYLLARECHRSIVGLRRLIHDGVLQRMAEHEAGPVAARFEAVSARGSGHSDLTAGTAMAGADFASKHTAELAEALRAASHWLAAALTVAKLYPPPRAADAEDRAALERINGREPCCANCARTRREDGQPRWEPIDSRLKDATTVGDRLPEPMALCVWCVDRTRAWGRLPTADELNRHHRGERVPWPADVARPA